MKYSDQTGNALEILMHYIMQESKGQLSLDIGCF